MAQLMPWFGQWWLVFSVVLAVLVTICMYLAWLVKGRHEETLSYSHLTRFVCHLSQGLEKTLCHDPEDKRRKLRLEATIALAVAVLALTFMGLKVEASEREHDTYKYQGPPLDWKLQQAAQSEKEERERRMESEIRQAQQQQQQALRDSERMVREERHDQERDQLRSQYESLLNKYENYMNQGDSETANQVRYEMQQVWQQMRHLVRDR